jgi:hypothetical protein
MRVSTFLPILSDSHHSFLDAHRTFLYFAHMILHAFLDFIKVKHENLRVLQLDKIPKYQKINLAL